MSIEQPMSERAEVGPIVDIVDIQSIEPEVPYGRGTIIAPQTAKQTSNICPGVTEEEGMECEKKTDDVGLTNRRKGSEVEYLEFSAPYFIPVHIAVTILASAEVISRGFDSIPSYTFCRKMSPHTSLIAQ